MVEKVDTVKVTHMKGAVIVGLFDRKDLSILENGDIATTACRGIFNTKKGFQGYSSLTLLPPRYIITSLPFIHYSNAAIFVI